jgi:TolB protein
MKKFSTTIYLIIFMALIVSACAPSISRTSLTATLPIATQTPTVETFIDPFAYCSAMGTIDSPDARYTGVTIPDEIIDGFKQAAGLESSTEPMEMLRQTTIWRCMDNKVYACNFGANLPCDSKANIDKTPAQELKDFCAANPDSNSIPMYVTGHETIYSWHCVGDSPEILDQIAEVDAAGFIANIWYEISPVSAVSKTATPAVEQTPVGGSGQILFGSNRGGDYSDLYMLDIASAEVTRLTQGDSNTFPGPFSPDGSQIVFTGFGLTKSYVGLMNADGSNPIDLTNQENSDEGFPAWSPDGKLIAFTSRRDGNNEVYVMNADGSNPIRLTNSPKDDFAPAWSPDGKQIAFVSDRDNTTGYYSIYLMNSDGTNVKRLTNDKGSDYTPIWSPDGTQIAFRSVQKDQSDIFLINMDGSGLVNLTNNPAEEWSPAWSPDGRLIAFQTNRDGNWEIYTMEPDGSKPTNLTNNPADDQMPYWK